MSEGESESPVWFVTGCSSGFGWEFACAAMAHRFRVVATARDPGKLAALIAGHETHSCALALDVTDPYRFSVR